MSLSDLNPRASIIGPDSTGRMTVITPRGETVLTYPIAHLFRFNNSLNDSVTETPPVVGTEEGAAIIYMPVFQGHSLYAAEEIYNYVDNPSFETNSDGWTAAGTSTVSRSGFMSFLGDYSLKWEYGGSGSTTISYDFGGTYLASSAAYALVMRLRRADGSGISLVNFSVEVEHEEFESTLVDEDASGWTLVYHNFQSPAVVPGGNTVLNITFNVNTTDWYIDAVGLINDLGTYEGQYFDGSMTGCEWDGTAHASNTTKPIIDLEYDHVTLSPSAPGAIIFWMRNLGGERPVAYFNSTNYFLPSGVSKFSGSDVTLASGGYLALISLSWDGSGTWTRRVRDFGGGGTTKTTGSYTPGADVTGMFVGHSGGALTDTGRWVMDDLAFLYEELTDDWFLDIFNSGIGYSTRNAPRVKLLLRPQLPIAPRHSRQDLTAVASAFLLPNDRIGIRASFLRRTIVANVPSAASIPPTLVAYTATNSTSASGLTVARPTGTTDDDVMFAFFWVDSSSATITPPTGWSFLNSESVAGHKLQGFWKRFDTADGDGPNYTFGLSVADGCALIVVSFRGLTTSTTPLSNTNSGAGTSADTYVSAAVSDSVVMHTVGLQSSSVDISAPSDYTLLVETELSGSPFGSLAVSYKIGSQAEETISSALSGSTDWLAMYTKMNPA